MDKKQYQKDLIERQRKHLEHLFTDNWKPCLHDNCTECMGTFLRKDGTVCFHMLSCDCPKCSPWKL